MYHEALATTTARRHQQNCLLVLANATKGWKFYTVKKGSACPSLYQMKLVEKTRFPATVSLEKKDQKDGPLRRITRMKGCFPLVALAVRKSYRKCWPRRADYQPAIPLIFCEADREPIKYLAALLALAQCPRLISLSPSART